MKIDIAYDSSANSAPAGFFTAVNAAVAYFNQLIANDITVRIVFSYGEMQGQAVSSGALAQSSTNGNIESFASLKGLLANAVTSADDAASVAALPASDPTNGGRFWVSDALAKVFGLSSQPGYIDPEDGFVALSSAVNFTFDPNNRAAPGLYDAVGAIEHEISEVLGRISYLGSGHFAGYRLYAPLDLFRYSGPGAHTVAYGPGYFSVDGQHMLYAFNDPNNGADGGDWAAGVFGDSFGYGSKGVAGLVSAVDIKTMDVLGFAINAAFATGRHTADDFNNDGKSDVLWRNDSGELYVWNSQAGQGAFVGQSLGNPGAQWHVAAVGDYNGDGKADVLWRDDAGDVYLYGSKAGVAVGFAGQSVSTVDPAWQITPQAGDFNGDGRSDVLWRNSVTGEVYAWNSTTPDTGVAFQGQSLGQVGLQWRVQGVGDFNGDHRDDILWRDDAGDVYVWLDSASGPVAMTGQTISTVGNDWVIQGIGDFNGDGREDILWRHGDGELYLWGSNAGADVSFTGQSLGGVSLDWSVAALGDYNGDGRADILFRNADGRTYVWNSHASGAVAFDGQGLGSTPTEWHVLSDHFLF